MKRQQKIFTPAPDLFQFDFQPRQNSKYRDRLPFPKRFCPSSKFKEDSYTLWTNKKLSSGRIIPTLGRTPKGILIFIYFTRFFFFLVITSINDLHCILVFRLLGDSLYSLLYDGEGFQKYLSSKDRFLFLLIWIFLRIQMK